MPASRTKDSFVSTLQNENAENVARFGIPETRQLTDEQTEVVRGVAARTQIREAQFRSAGATVTAAKIAKGQLSRSEAIEEATAAGYDQLTTSALESLAEARGKIADPAVDKLVEDYMITADDQPLIDYVESRRAELADISDTGTMDREITALENYVRLARQINVRSRFWKAAEVGSEGTDIELREAFTILEEFKVVFNSDFEIGRGLRLAGLELRRDNYLLSGFRALAVESPNFDQVNNFLQRIEATTGQIGDSEEFGGTLATIARTAFRAEIDRVFDDLVGKVEVSRDSVAALRAALETVPTRAPVGGENYLLMLREATAKFNGILEAVEDVAIQQEVIEIRKRFVDDPDLASVVDSILELPEGDLINDELRQGLLDELSFITAARRGLDPARFDSLQGLAIEGIRRSRQPSEMGLDLTETPEGRNLEAVRTVVRRFKTTLMPLFESIRGSEEVEEALLDIITNGGRGIRNEFVQKIALLEQQRDLTDIERAYLESVELLSIFNPHLVALARERPELTSLYLEQYFGDLDQSTKEQLREDIYVPMISIGLGPQGLAAAGELVRSNPVLAEQVLYIDAAALPGGPFGQARGPSWELNSANGVGGSTNVLPDVISADEQGISVRSYGSPLVAFPGERIAGQDTRPGSINATVDYLINPDQVAPEDQYPDNTDLARVLQLQSALLVDHVLLSTRVVDVESLVDPRAESAPAEYQPAADGLPGNKRVTIEFQTASGETVTTTIRTDAILGASGLGEKTFGFELAGSQAERLLASERNTTTLTGFPLLTDTIEAFEIMSNPEERPVAPEGTVVIYGGGNSADVLAEYLGRQFKAGNPALGKVDKILILSSTPSSERPRYFRVIDLKGRGGKKNLVENLPVRVGDVALESDGRLAVLDDQKRPIMIEDSDGRQVPLKANHVISAAGFRPELDRLFATLLAPGESIDRRAGLQRISLPSNPGFGIASQLSSDPDVVFVGTASDADFKNQNKLAQLPLQASEALQKNGAENAVAIGFRGPDTRAAVRIKFGKWQGSAPGEMKHETRQRPPIQVSETTQEPGRTVPFVSGPRTRRTVPADSETLTALLLDEVAGTSLEGDIPAEGAGYGFTIRVNSEGFVLYTEGDGVPSGLTDVLAEALSEPYFQAYALKAIRGRRASQGLGVQLSFTRQGKLRLRDKPSSLGPSITTTRTYVEVL